MLIGRLVDEWVGLLRRERSHKKGKRNKAGDNGMCTALARFHACTGDNRSRADGYKY